MITISLENGNTITIEDKRTETKSEEFFGCEIPIGMTISMAIVFSLLKYGYVCRGGDEWLGIRGGLDPEKQWMTEYYKGMYSTGLELYGRGDKTDKQYYPFAANGCGDYLCVGQDNKIYEYIHDLKNPIVDFAKEYNVPECKDFNWYLNNVILGTRSYYGEQE